MIRVLISADMEGSSGITSWDDVMPGRPDYERGRRLMTGDVNAAIRGALEGGADEVWVNDSHNTMRNILIDELEPDAQLILGAEKPRGMMEGVEEVDLVFFTGYHDLAGGRGVLAHTYWRALAHVKVNGLPGSEALVNAAVAGELGIPVVLITGDDLTCEAAERTFTGIKAVTTKHSISPHSARCSTPGKVGENIVATAREAVRNATDSEPFRLETPVVLEVELRDAAQATAAVAGIERLERVDTTSVLAEVDSAAAAYSTLDTIGALATA